MTATQLAFDLPTRVALNQADFLVTEANAQAVAVIDKWPDWPTHAVVIVGPEGSGKTHLSHVFQQTSGATRIESGALTREKVPEFLLSGALALEVVDGRLDEVALFHALNLARQDKASILITARNAPSLWTIALPDLKSRLQAMPTVALLPPDDELLAGVVLKLFTDRQLMPAENVMPYVLQRMPRSLLAAQKLVTEIDHRALAERANITRPFVAKVLEDMEQRNMFGENA